VVNPNLPTVVIIDKNTAPDVVSATVKPKDNRPNKPPKPAAPIPALVNAPPNRAKSLRERVEKKL